MPSAVDPDDDLWMAIKQVDDPNIHVYVLYVLTEIDLPIIRGIRLHRPADPHHEGPTLLKPATNHI